jgi:von Willebrand factor type A domain
MLKRISIYLLSALLLALGLSNSAFAQADKKVAHGLLVDNTGSLRTQFVQVVLLSKEIVKQIHKQGPISLFNFQTHGDKKKGNQVALITPGTEWSEDKNLLDNYIDSLSVVPGQTSLMDAINLMAYQLNAKVNHEKDAFADKVIFLITDGEERISKITEKELISSLKESGIKVYAVGLINELDAEGGLVRKSQRAKAEAFLKRVTKETGGRVVFPKSKRIEIGKVLNELFAK